MQLNDPRLQGEGFKRGRFEIDHRPRPPDLLLVMVPETTWMRCFGAQTGQALKAQRAIAAAVSSHDATSLSFASPEGEGFGPRKWTMMPGAHSIGTLANASGCRVQTTRWYEQA